MNSISIKNCDHQIQNQSFETKVPLRKRLPSRAPAGISARVFSWIGVTDLIKAKTAISEGHYSQVINPLIRGAAKLLVIGASLYGVYYLLYPKPVFVNEEHFNAMNELKNTESADLSGIKKFGEDALSVRANEFDEAATTCMTKPLTSNAEGCKSLANSFVKHLFKVDSDPKTWPKTTHERISTCLTNNSPFCSELGKELVQASIEHKTDTYKGLLKSCNALTESTSTCKEVFETSLNYFFKVKDFSKIKDIALKCMLGKNPDGKSIFSKGVEFLIHENSWDGVTQLLGKCGNKKAPLEECQTLIEKANTVFQERMKALTPPERSFLGKMMDKGGDLFLSEETKKEFNEIYELFTQENHLARIEKEDNAKYAKKLAETCLFTKDTTACQQPLQSLVENKDLSHKEAVSLLNRFIKSPRIDKSLYTSDLFMKIATKGPNWDGISPLVRRCLESTCADPEVIQKSWNKVLDEGYLDHALAFSEAVASHNKAGYEESLKQTLNKLIASNRFEEAYKLSSSLLDKNASLHEGTLKEILTSLFSTYNNLPTLPWNTNNNIWGWRSTYYGYLYSNNNKPQDFGLKLANEWMKIKIKNGQIKPSFVALDAYNWEKLLGLKHLNK